MRVYRINIGAERDEWWATLREAVERRKDLITARYDPRVVPLSIDAVDLVKLPPKSFAIILLNRHHRGVHPEKWIKAHRQVVPPYKGQVDSNDSTE